MGNEGMNQNKRPADEMSGDGGDGGGEQHRAAGDEPCQRSWLDIQPVRVGVFDTGCHQWSRCDGAPTARGEGHL